MSKHIHIYLPSKTKDTVKHAPAGTSKGGQFVSGSGGGGGGSSAPTKKANASSGPDEDKIRARVKAAREGMQAAGKNKAEYERHEAQFEESTAALLAHQEKSKNGPKAGSNPKEVYAGHRKDAGSKGQAALDLAEKAKSSKDPKVVEAAVSAANAAFEAHKKAAASFANVPFPGNSDAGAHHEERMKAYGKLTESMSQRLHALTKS